MMRTSFSPKGAFDPDGNRLESQGMNRSQPRDVTVGREHGAREGYALVAWPTRPV
jgi:hypothetical protein